VIYSPHDNGISGERLTERLRAEYLEMPGMKLKLEQVQRLCGIERSTCKAALEALVDAMFLRVKSDGSDVPFGHEAVCQLVAHRLPEPVACAGQPRHHRARRHAHHVGDLPVRETL
jgi:hypothetical protein